MDDIVEPEDLRDELVRRFAVARGKDRTLASAPPRDQPAGPGSVTRVRPALATPQLLLFLYYLL